MKVRPSLVSSIHHIRTHLICQGSIQSWSIGDDGLNTVNRRGCREVALVMFQDASYVLIRSVPILTVLLLPTCVNLRIMNCMRELSC